MLLDPGAGEGAKRNVVRKRRLRGGFRKVPEHGQLEGREDVQGTRAAGTPGGGGATGGC